MAVCVRVRVCVGVVCQAAVAAAERAKAARELADLKRTVGDFKKLQVRGSLCCAAPCVLSVCGNGWFTTNALPTQATPAHILRDAKAMKRSTSTPVVSARSSMSHSGHARPPALPKVPMSPMASAAPSRRTRRSARADSRRPPTASSAATASSRITNASALRTPKSWRGKTLDELLAKKRAQRTAREQARG